MIQNNSPRSLTECENTTFGVEIAISDYDDSVGNVEAPGANVRVLHVINGEYFSGAERVQDLLAHALPEFGYDVGFACLKPNKFPEVRTSDTDLFSLKMSSKFDFSQARKLAEHFRQGDYAILHAHTPRSLLIANMAAKQLGCPLVYHVHSPVGRDSENGLRNRINTWVEKWNLRRVDRLICVSQSLANYMQSLGHAEEKISVALNGVPVVDDLRERQPPQGTWTIGSMALFRPRKGLEVLLEALAILKERDVPVSFRAVGPFINDEYEADILALVERLGIADMVTWMGFQSDVNEQLEEMDLLVLPSLYGEGLPMVVLEAMACGVPVVASRVEGVPEALRDQVDGLIVEPNDPGDLADKLSSIVGDQSRWQEMRSNAINRHRDALSDKVMSQNVANVYNELLA